nr:MAK10-like protein [Tanacetum cinerariifolium]
MAKQMEWVTKQARLILPYGMLLIRLFNFIIDENSELKNESYVLYDRVMNPLAAQLEKNLERIVAREEVIIPLPPPPSMNHLRLISTMMMMMMEIMKGPRVQVLLHPFARRTIDQSAGGKLRDRNAEESWELLEDLALYDNESWNEPWDFAKPVKAISLPQDVSSTSDRRLIELENQVQRLMEAHIAHMQPTQVNRITSSCEIYNGPHDTQYCMENPEQTFVKYASSRTDEAGADGTKSYPVGIIKDVEVHIGKLKLLNDFYVIDMKKYPKTALLVKRKHPTGPSSDGVGAQTPYYARKDFLDCHFPGEYEITRGAEINPFKDVLVFRRMNKPPKNRDGAWHAKIRLIDPDGEEFTKPYNKSPLLESSPKEKAQGRSSTWTTSMTRKSVFQLLGGIEGNTRDLAHWRRNQQDYGPTPKLLKKCAHRVWRRRRQHKATSS